MFAVKRSIRTLIFIILVNDISCQDVFTEHDFRRLQQQIASPDRQDAATSYNSQIEQIRNDQSGANYNIHYHLAEENEDYRSNHGRSDRRKVIRIKNPFQRQLDDGDRHQQDNSVIKDTDSGASNQYAAMQYSLPPEDFLRQMRSESQFNQQYSTPAPAALSYTATPQPQYQYSTPAPNYDNNQQTLQFGQLDPQIAQAQAFHGNPPNSYQFSGSYPFDGSASASASAFDNVQSTPSPMPPFLSTITNNQYIGTPASTFVSSSAPVVSSQPNVQYVSSPAAVQTSSIDYGRSSTGASNNNYDNSEINKRIQIDHYDNSANGIRYPVQQFSPNEYPSSTAAPPTSSPYSEQINDNWNNSPSSNALAKSLQEATLAHYQNSPYYNLAQESRYDYQESGDTHRVGNMPAANNIYLNYVHPEQPNNNARTRTRDLEQETGQPDSYSHGEYGWKLNEKKQLQGNDYYSQGSLPVQYQSNLHSESPSSYFMSFRHDSSRPHNYESISKSAQESLDAQEFAKAAAKAHENMKQQQTAKLNTPYFGHNYVPNFSTSDPLMNSQSQSQSIVSTFYGNLDKQKSKLFAESSNNNPFVFSSSQPDLMTASPYYIFNTKDSAESKSKLPFDHAKALKQIVPMDVSNVINSNEAALKAAQENKLNIQNFSRDQAEQNFKQFYKPIADTYYKDKNTGYGFNIKAKPEDISGPEGVKPYENNQQYYPKPQDSPYTQLDSKKYSEQQGQGPQNYQSQASSYSNNQQQAPNTPRQQNLVQSDFTSILKLNDIPYRITQGIPPEALRLHNNNFDQASIPTPIPNRINQNVGNHQIDVAILTKLLQQAKQQNINGNIDLQPTAPMSTVNGFRVANPFNVDLKLVHEMLKGKPVIDDSKMSYLRDQYNKPMPINFDMSAIQQLLLRNDIGSFGPLNDGIGPYVNPYADIYGRYPYQGVKYSRSQEEEESLIPIADASSNHPIGAVMEQYEAPDGREASSDSELTIKDENAAQTDDKQQKNVFRDLKLPERHRHPNSLPGRHYFPRKYHKDDLEQYLLLRPPPVHFMRSRSSHSKVDRRGRRRVVGRKPKFPRSLKAEQVFENESKTVDDESENPVQLLLQPPPLAESRSDKNPQKEKSS